MNIIQFKKQYIYITQLIASFLLVSLLVACSSPKETETDMTNTTNPTNNNNGNSNSEQAKVTAVTNSGTANNYTFSVTIESPDTGCDQYADWWEVFNEDGDLIYRRILGHSHVNEQPFTRSGGAVAIGPDDFIYVRAHMNNLGYGTAVFSGTIGTELKADTLDTSFASELETTAPLPDGCAF